MSDLSQEQRLTVVAPHRLANVGVHGGGRRPGRQAALDLFELSKWNAAQRAAVAVNRDRPRAEARRDAIVVRDSGL